VARSQRARPYHLELPALGDDKTGSRPGINPPEISDFSLPDYAKDWKQIDARLRQLKGLLEKIEFLATNYRAIVPESEQAGPPAEPKGPAALTPAYAHLRSMRHNFGPPSPALWLADLQATNFAPGWGLGQGVKFQLTDLTSDPELLGRPVKAALASEDDVRIETSFNVHRPGTPHDVSFEARDIALGRLVDTSKVGRTFTVSGGHLHLAGKGTMSRREVDLPLEVGLRDLSLRLVGEQNFAGLSSDLWNQGLAKLGGFTLHSRLSGRWQSPRLSVNTKDLADQFESQLRAAGHAVLAQAVEAQLARGQQIVADAVKQAAGEAQGVIDEQRAKADAAINTAEQHISQASDHIQQEGARAQQGIGAAQNKVQSEADKFSAHAGQQLDGAGAAANEWLSRIGGGLPGGNPLTQAAQQTIDSTTAQGKQHLDSQHQSTAHVVDDGAAAARMPLSQLLERAAAADQSAQHGVAETRGQLNTTAGGASQAVGASAAQANQWTSQAAQGVRSALPGDGSSVSTNTPAAIGRYTELHAGSAPPPAGAATAYPKALVPSASAPHADAQSGAVATAEDSTVPHAAGDGAGASYPSSAYPSTLPSYPSTAPYPNYPSTAPDERSHFPPAQQGTYQGSATPPANQAAHPAAPAASPYPSTPPPYPTTAPQYPITPYPTTPPPPQTESQHPHYPAAPPQGSPTSGLYPLTPPPSGEALPSSGSSPPWMNGSGAEYPQAGASTSTAPGVSTAQDTYPSDFYSDEPESPAYEAGGKYELANPPQGAGIGRRRNPAGPGEAAGSDDPGSTFSAPPLPLENEFPQPIGQPPSGGGSPPMYGPAGYAPSASPPGGFNYGAPSGQPGQPSAASSGRPLPVALRARESAEEAARRPGPPPVALRGRRPMPMPGQASPSDEWQITRWTRETGSSVKNFLLGGSSQPPANSFQPPANSFQSSVPGSQPPMQQGPPPQSFSHHYSQPTQGPGYQLEPLPYAGPQHQPQSPANDSGPGYGYGNAPLAGRPTNGQAMRQTMGNQPGPPATATQQAAQPWYKIW
jgi:hypothetical protein